MAVFKHIQAVSTLWLRELIRFYRQPSRVVGALGTPVVFWLLIGSGIGTSFQAGSGLAQSDYLRYFFPGTIMLILLFTAIFSTISIIEDRKEGFLQAVLVSPISRGSFVFGKLLGGATLAFIQAVLFLILAPWLGIQLSFAGWLQLAGVVFLIAFALTGLGFIIAWKLHSIQGFHAIMNLFLMPMWFLSGALFPGTGSPAWIQIAMQWNPLTYGMSALRQSLYGTQAISASESSLALSLGITALFGAVIFILSTVLASQRKADYLS